VKGRRRLAWLVWVLALLALLLIGAWRALHHEEPRPVESHTPAAP
jgi:hypothetical protein